MKNESMECGADQLWSRLTTIEERLTDLQAIRGLLDKQITELETEKVEAEQAWNQLVRDQWKLEETG